MKKEAALTLQCMFLYLACGVLAAIMSIGAPPPRLQFEKTVVDEAAPQDLWLKSAGDLNGDGKPDLIAGGHRSGGLVWYENWRWTRRVIASEEAFSTDGEAADIDGDGDQDVVALTAKQLVWFENPDWTPHRIDDIVLHDIEVADFDGDGRPDVAGRNQGAFPPQRGNAIFLYMQQEGGTWRKQLFGAEEGEGLLVTDINRDGKPDIVAGRVWYENGTWTGHRFSDTWTHPHTFAAAGDINGDGRVDIVLAPSEREGGSYRISWFEAPKDPAAEPWKEHVVAELVQTVHHFVGVADFDGDGNLDIATAAMAQGRSPEIAVCRNLGGGRSWSREVVEPVSSHSMRILDWNNDGRPDLFGGDWRGHVVSLWTNKTPAAL